MIKKYILGVVLLLLSTFSFGQKIDDDSLNFISKIQFCKDFGLGHTRVILNGEDICETEVKKGNTPILSKNITLGVFDSIEIFLVGTSAGFNKFQFIILSRYDGIRIKNLEIDDLNNFSRGTSSLNVIDKSYVFLFSRYTGLYQYFFTLSQEAYVENLTIQRTSDTIFNLEKYKIVKFSKGYKVYVLTKENIPRRTRNIYEKHLFIFNKKEELIHYSMKAIELDNKILNKKW